MESPIAERLKNYINAETGDAALYRRLAGMTEDENARELLNSLSDDEAEHAERFGKLYRALTGREYAAPEIDPEITGSFADALRDRVLDESGDYRKYAREAAGLLRSGALSSPRRDYPLYGALRRASEDEATHALRLLYILAGIK